jgi:hypothetical protein
MAIASILAGMPDLVHRILSEHVPDDRGRCQECRGSSPTAAWPCVLREMGEEAREIRDGGLPGTYGGRHRAGRPLSG